MDREKNGQDLCGSEPELSLGSLILLCFCLPAPSALSLDATEGFLFALQLGAYVLCNNTLENLCLNSADHILSVAAFSALELVELLSAIHGTLCVEGKLNWPEHNFEPFLCSNSTLSATFRVGEQTWWTQERTSQKILGAARPSHAEIAS